MDLQILFSFVSSTSLKESMQTPKDCPIYLDYNATTPLDPAVSAAMLPYLQVACVFVYLVHAMERVFSVGVLMRI